MNGYEFCVGYWWIFPLVMIFLCFMFARRARGRGRGMCGFCAPRGYWESPLDILDRRYAKGEIDQGEYEEKKQSIEDDQQQ